MKQRRVFFSLPSPFQIPSSRSVRTVQYCTPTVSGEENPWDPRKAWSICLFVVFLNAQTRSKNQVHGTWPYTARYSTVVAQYGTVLYQTSP
jgi:hypothetical protein